MKTFLIRAISALVAISLMLGVYLKFDAEGIKLISIVCVIIGQLELARLLALSKQSPLNQLFLLVPTVVSFLALCTLPLTWAFSISVLVWMLGSGVALKIFVNQGIDEIFRQIASLSVSMIYGALLPIFCIWILDTPKGLWWFCSLLLVVFAGDTMAYISGSLLGRTKILPQLSPKKTWQGAVGGLLGSFLIGFTANYFFKLTNQTLLFGVVCIFAGLMGQIGDFFESALKRKANVKDSGSIMPGHGGVLDRLDGVYFAGPLFYILILIFESGT